MSLNLPGLVLKESYEVLRAQSVQNDLGEHVHTWVPWGQVAVQGFDYPLSNQGAYRAGLLNIVATREAIVEPLPGGLIPESMRLVRTRDEKMFTIKNSRNWTEAGAELVQLLLEEVQP